MPLYKRIFPTIGLQGRLWPTTQPNIVEHIVPPNFSTTPRRLSSQSFDQHQP